MDKKIYFYGIDISKDYRIEQRKEMPNTKIAEVVLDKLSIKVLDYQIPAILSHLTIGSRVKVPIKKSYQLGYITAVKDSSPIKDPLPIKEEADQPIPYNLIALLKWISQYYCTPLSKVFYSLIPRAIKKESRPAEYKFLKLKSTKKEIIRRLPEIKTRAPAQAKALEFFLKHKKGYQNDIVKELNITPSVINTLINRGYIKAEKRTKIFSDHLFDLEYFSSIPKVLNEEQKKAVSNLTTKLNSFSTTLLFGVTGSGKTEVYLNLISKVLDSEKSVLVLVPEVALTIHLVEKFKSRFDRKIAVIHHRRTASARKEVWKKILSQEIKMVIGARSAVFAPLKDIGLIVVDEEHDSSYKQTEEMPTYNARDVAVMRAKIENCPIILGSATPSLESYNNAKNGKYNLITMKERISSKLPIISICDMKNSRGYISPKLLDAILTRYKAGEQSILFLNRRGYRAIRICDNCSETTGCPNCDMALVYHKKEDLLRCHLCNYDTSKMSPCENCNGRGPFTYRGVGTEHLEKTLQKLAPQLNVVRLDRDTTTKKGAYEEIFHKFSSSKANVMIGTQMVAKGLDFPEVTLVGIVNLDATLTYPHFRANEILFQMITQVAGRGGRRERQGEVILQTSYPDHPMILQATEGDYVKFYDSEMKNRESFQFPPFVKLSRILVTSKNYEVVKDKIWEIYNGLKEVKGIQCFQPIDSFKSKINGYYRMEFMCKSANIGLLSNYLRSTSLFDSYYKVIIDIDHIV